MKRGYVRLAIAAIALLALVRWLDHSEPTAVDEWLEPQGTVEARYGLAVAIAIDVSSSMNLVVDGRDGRAEAKIVTARRAALDLVDQFATYAREHPDEPVELGLYEFSDRGRDVPDCREVVPMGPPDRERAAAAIAGLVADGDTPIGQAMITTKRALDATGLTRRHLLLVTDGENTSGPTPQEVAVAIRRRPTTEQPAIYFVAFDVQATLFDAIRDAGGLVVSATNATELKTTLDVLLRDEILVEK